jgi:SAM-dependent methyltransferase
VRWATRRTEAEGLISRLFVAAAFVTCQSGPVADLVAESYDAIYTAWPSSPTLHAIWMHHAVDGPYPAGFEHISFSTGEELRQIANALHLHPGERLIDLACGAGGPGLWTAREARVVLVGVDLSRIGLRLAARRAIDRAISHTSFIVADATAIGLADGCAAGVMSVDALQYVPDKSVALGEVARLLSPGGRLVFTAFELNPDRVADLPVLGVDPISDYRALLREGGFRVDSYDETPGWRHRVDRTYSALLAARDALAPEMGEQALGALLMEVTLTLEVGPYQRRILAVAVKQEP